MDQVTHSSTDEIVEQKAEEIVEELTVETPQETNEVVEQETTEPEVEQPIEPKEEKEEAVPLVDNFVQTDLQKELAKLFTTETQKLIKERPELTPNEWARINGSVDRVLNLGKAQMNDAVNRKKILEDKIAEIKKGLEDLTEESPNFAEISAEIDEKVAPLINQSEKLLSFIEMKKQEINLQDALRKEILKKTPTIIGAIHGAMTILGITNTILNNESVMEEFHKDLENLRSSAKDVEENAPIHYLIMKYVSTSKAKSELILRLNEYEGLLGTILNTYKVGLGKEIPEIPPINWMGATREDRYGAFDKVIKRIVDEITDYYNANVFKLDNEDAKEIYKCMVLGNSIILDVGIRESILSTRLFMPEPEVGNRFMVETYLMPIARHIFKNKPEADICLLYVLSSLQYVDRWWQIFILAGVLDKPEGESDGKEGDESPIPTTNEETEDTTGDGAGEDVPVDDLRNDGTDEEFVTPATAGN